MAKRHAEEPLEDVQAVDSPASKRARVEEEVGGHEAPNGAGESSSRPLPDRLNGHRFEEDARQGNDILAAADQEQEELEEAAGIDDDDDEERGEEDEEEVASALTVPARQAAPAAGYGDLYLDTIDRALLDFDFEKLCSVTLSNINVYACLICGKYYQGRGPKSHAYFHALELGHHVFINMETQRVYVLPEGYEVKSKSLDDIRYVVDPRYSKEEVARLDRVPRTAWDLGGKQYRPGFVGMNNIKDNDYFNVVIQALSHVVPLRNFLMLEDFSTKPQLVQRLSMLVRKIWNPKAFKGHVSPHELLQEIAQRSNKRFTLTAQADPADFLGWFLNNVHLALGGSRTKPGTSIIQKVFQGRLKVESQQITAKADAGDRLRFEEAAEVRVEESRFLMLTLDLPAAPLFQDELDRNIIPQVPLTTILSKYDGLSSQEHLAHRRRYRLLQPLPPYLLLHIKRFSRNKFVSERNPTIVTFPSRALDMSPYVQPSPAHHPPGEPIWYDLAANITHEAQTRRGVGEDGGGGSGAAGTEGGGDGGPRKVWRVQLRDRARGDEWAQVQDLFVEEARKEILFLGEAYLQVWERRRG
ncbi:MAG: hypothetical protein M1832_003277 [Thelocarpon impressellum]|nr:MAG: hypothetical protein M1832_003277 [Thelocarpon impressellum]